MSKNTPSKTIAGLDVNNNFVMVGDTVVFVKSGAYGRPSTDLALGTVISITSHTFGIQPTQTNRYPKFTRRKHQKCMKVTTPVAKH